MAVQGTPEGIELRCACPNGGLRSGRDPIPIRQPLPQVLNLLRDSVMASLASERCRGPSILALLARTWASESPDQLTVRM